MENLQNEIWYRCLLKTCLQSSSNLLEQAEKSEAVSVDLSHWRYFFSEMEPFANNLVQELNYFYEAGLPEKENNCQGAIDKSRNYVNLHNLMQRRMVTDSYWRQLPLCWKEPMNGVGENIISDLMRIAEKVEHCQNADEKEKARYMLYCGLKLLTSDCYIQMQDRKERLILDIERNGIAERLRKELLSIGIPLKNTDRQYIGSLVADACAPLSDDSRTTTLALLQRRLFDNLLPVTVENGQKTALYSVIKTQAAEFVAVAKMYGEEIRYLRQVMQWSDKYKQRCLRGLEQKKPINRQHRNGVCESLEQSWHRRLSVLILKQKANENVKGIKNSSVLPENLLPQSDIKFRKEKILLQKLQIQKIEDTALALRQKKFWKSYEENQDLPEEVPEIKKFLQNLTRRWLSLIYTGYEDFCEDARLLPEEKSRPNYQKIFFENGVALAQNILWADEMSRLSFGIPLNNSGVNAEHINKIKKNIVKRTFNDGGKQLLSLLFDEFRRNYQAQGRSFAEVDYSWRSGNFVDLLEKMPDSQVKMKIAGLSLKALTMLEKEAANEVEAAEGACYNQLSENDDILRENLADDLRIGAEMYSELAPIMALNPEEIIDRKVVSAFIIPLYLFEKTDQNALDEVCNFFPGWQQLSLSARNFVKGTIFSHKEALEKRHIKRIESDGIDFEVGADAEDYWQLKKDYYQKATTCQRIQNISEKQEKIWREYQQFKKRESAYTVEPLANLRILAASRFFYN